MTLRRRYAMLTGWNKIAFWGSVASILGLAAAVLSWLCAPSTSLHQETYGNQSPAVSGVKGNVHINQQQKPTR